MFAGDTLWNLLGTVFLVVMGVYLVYYFATTGRDASKRGLLSEFRMNSRIGIQNFFAYYLVNAFRFLNRLWNPTDKATANPEVLTPVRLGAPGRVKVTCPHASPAQNDVWIGLCERCQNACRFAGESREAILKQVQHLPTEEA